MLCRLTIRMIILFCLLLLKLLLLLLLWSFWASNAPRKMKKEKKTSCGWRDLARLDSISFNWYLFKLTDPIIPMAITPLRMLTQPQQFRILKSIDEFSIHKQIWCSVLFLVPIVRSAARERDRQTLRSTTQLMAFKFVNRIFRRQLTLATRLTQFFFFPLYHVRFLSSRCCQLAQQQKATRCKWF